MTPVGVRELVKQGKCASQAAYSRLAPVGCCEAAAAKQKVILALSCMDAAVLQNRRYFIAP